MVVLRGRGIGEPATSTLNDDERGKLAHMLKKGFGCRRADDQQATPVTNMQYPFKSGSFMSPTVEGIPSGKAVARTLSNKAVADNSSDKAVAGILIPSDIAVAGRDSEAKRHCHNPVSRSRSILSHSLYSNANIDASELDVSEKIALDLNKAKDWQKPVGVPQLTALDDVDLSTHVEPEPTGALLPGASSVAKIKERAVLRKPSAAQSKELNRLHMDLEESVVIPKVSDSTNAYGALSDRTLTARVVTPSRKAVERFGYNYGK